MYEAVFNLLNDKKSPKDWDVLKERWNPQPFIYHNGEPVYQFFETFDDSLDMSLQPISLSVNPIESFVPYHTHNYVEIIIPIKGTVRILTASEELQINENDIFIVGPNTVHQNLPITKDDLILNIAIKQTAFSQSDLSFLRRSGGSDALSDMLFFQHHSDSQVKEIYTIFSSKDEDGLTHTLANMVFEYYRASDLYSSRIIRYELLVFITKLMRLNPRKSKELKNSKNTETILFSILMYIEKNYADLTLEALGAAFGFNANYLSTYLKQNTGHSFIKLVHMQRVKVACEYLTYTQSPIEQIALKVGYENPSYFYKIFKKILGVSPAGYRDQNKKERY
ncbi:helix-turn-helix domain-containing protein [Tuanshanicoccus lijuaniae]|uniref:helix-turn-helix domain-containing protein n=1 Tax=Aerococcaceae bacterium zg-1292 TaxID=2774330 RepID=UPI001937BBE1|nr:helix-turn-helix domain-containing protein [Aerococcaceae bacterium zg-1292]MBF6978921.1 helix-turn-helix domain-containing protein [Aerococcaceae bacterium zg-BR22]MBS4455355.1 helix-turn-helix domain-containing protein [Aerococcaceae bacterium zg-A91]MBS4457315.1 helix-turn-helix domain-containing protein [Aerococcaceae bacterium zg-BR33]QQA36837.1 helix-turn-helix domain-containing protein [Aerococcaceae bacterium zg-1292]